MSALLTIEDPAYFARLATIEASHWWSLGMWRLASYWLDHALRGRAHLRALDAGCGAGLTASRLSSRPEISETVALDMSDAALVLARQRYDGPVVSGSVLDLPFPNASFHVVTCFDVFQHLPRESESKAASEINRVLKPGGDALIRVNGRGGWNPAQGGPAPYTVNELEELFRTAGLSIARSTYANCLPAMIQELRGWRRRAGGHPAGGGLRIAMPHPMINKLMRISSYIEALAAGRLGIHLPFGHSTMLLAKKVGRSSS
jgi:SAM-dependent methyltransferase